MTRAIGLALIALLAVLFVTPAQAEEQILFFGSDIQVRSDSGLDVTETIRVRAEGAAINHGIYRDFPTSYRTTYGRQVKVGFEVVSVLRDGVPEPWVAEPLWNGVRIRIGDGAVIIPPGEYEYQIRYRTDRQLGFFPDYDELYWNVTGTGWDFPILIAEARVRLPRAAGFGNRAFYTGPEGSTAGNAQVSAEAPGDITIRTTAPLGSRENLTVAVAWPKGVVTEPADAMRAGWWLADNGPFAAGILGLIATLLFYFTAWRRAGRGPGAGTVVPIFSPPDGLTPAGMRYIQEMGSDNRSFAAALLDLGVRGKIRLVEGEGGFFSRGKTTIEKRGDPGDLPPAEASMMRALFANGDTILMDNDNHKDFSTAQKALDRQLKSQYEGTMFLRNSGWAWRGLGVLLLALLGTAAVILFAAPYRNETAELTAWAALAVASLAGVLLVWPIQDSTPRLAARIVGGLAGLAALGLCGAVILMALQFGQALPLVFLLPALPVAISAFSWMAAPTRRGRAVLDRIAGFKHYLSITEEERLATLHPPDKTPELFEKYLPYAVALKVENAWADRFTSVLAAAAVAGQAQTFGWYSGHDNPWTDTGDFVDRVGSSLASSVASASTAPGSSSGSSGGGSSGGGGGGGGGGGW